MYEFRKESGVDSCSIDINFQGHRKVEKPKYVRARPLLKFQLPSLKFISKPNSWFPAIITVSLYFFASFSFLKNSENFSMSSGCPSRLKSPQYSNTSPSGKFPISRLSVSPWVSEIHTKRVQFAGLGLLYDKWFTTSCVWESFCAFQQSSGFWDNGCTITFTVSFAWSSPSIFDLDPIRCVSIRRIVDKLPEKAKSKRQQVNSRGGRLIQARQLVFQSSSPAAKCCQFIAWPKILPFVVKVLYFLNFGRTDNCLVEVLFKWSDQSSTPSAAPVHTVIYQNSIQ